jgi:hypothetical protein
MHSLAGDVAGVFGWTMAQGSYDEPVNNVLLSLEEEDLDSFTSAEDLQMVRAHAAVRLWEKAVQQAAAKLSFVADGVDLDRSLFQAMLEKNLAAARSELLPYDPNYFVGVHRIPFRHDPYAYRDDEEREVDL